MRIKLYPLLWLSVCLGLGLASCKDDKDNKKDEGEAVNQTELLNSYLKSLADPLQEAVPEDGNEGSASNPQAIGDMFTEMDEKENLYCECQKYSAGAKFDENMILDPTVGVIYPGSIIDGNSVVDGSYREIVVDRAPITISTDFMNKTGDCQMQVENPKVSNVRSAIKQMLYDNEITGSTAAYVTCDVKRVSSREALNLAVGTTISGGKISLEDKFSWGNNKVKQRFLMNVIQRYYTIDVDPQKPSDFFAPTVTAEELQDAIGSHATPVYVSSVSYGRVAYVAIECEEENDSLFNDLKATASLFSTKETAKTTVGRGKEYKNFSFSATIIGGDGSDAANAISAGKSMDDLVAGLNTYINNGGRFGPESPGSMISYKLTKLSDHKVFSVNKATEYVTRKCRSLMGGGVFPKHFLAEQLDGTNDIFGTIKAHIEYADGSISEGYLFLESEDQSRKDFETNVEKHIEVGKKYNIDPPASPLRLDNTKLEGAYLVVDLDVWDRDWGSASKHGGNKGGGNDGMAAAQDWINGKCVTNGKSDGRSTLRYSVDLLRKKYSQLPLYRYDDEGNIIVELRDCFGDDGNVILFAFKVDFDD